MIKTLKIQSFKSIESVEIELGTVNVFIGANGSGKSNLLEGLAVLAAAASGRVDSESLVRRGCRPGGLFRPHFPGNDLAAETEVAASSNGINYFASLDSPGPGRRPGEWRFGREVWKDGENTIVDRRASPETGDPQAGLAALKMAEMPVGHPAAVFLNLLAGYSVYTPDTPILRGWTQDPQLRQAVGLSGGRLADAVAELQSQRGFSKLRELLAGGVEWFGNIDFGTFEGANLPANQNQKRFLAFADRFFRTEPFRYFLSASEVNEGTLYVLFVAVLCLHDFAPTLFALDNADHGLNPLLVKNLMQAMCDWLLTDTRERQVLMTTQNPLALDGLPLGDDRVRLFAVDRDNRGRTILKRVIITEQLRKKAAEGWPLSRIWVNGLIGGVPNV